MQPQEQYTRAFESINPFTNEVIAHVPFLNDDELLKKIEKSWDAFQTYKDSDIKSKIGKILKLASLIEANAEKCAKIVTEEMGKLFKDSTAEVMDCVKRCQYYADNAEKFLKPQEISSVAKQSRVEYHGTGPIFVITPFNYPFEIAFTNSVPHLLMGNTIIFRTSDSTPRLGQAIEDLFVEAGFNNGEFQNVYSSIPQTELVISHRYIRGVTFTGSTRSGRIIASLAGKYGKKIVLELGGSDPFVVLDDADIEKATDLALIGRLTNCGQLCCASKRFIIDENVYDEFKDKLVNKLSKFKIGNPMNPETNLGPLARPDLLTNIERQVKQGLDQGAKLVFGGKRPEEAELKAGNFYIPAVCEVEKGNILLNEETFGPVFALVKVKGEKEAVKFANDTEYGLGCVIVSENIDRAQKVGHQIESGMIYINDWIQEDEKFPFGGVKGSGVGRINGVFGIYEFANAKTVWIN
jgi:succinate-semialdehyde dehydrogenase/glutarate-semialdehyde dehydrogenase